MNTLNMEDLKQCKDSNIHFKYAMFLEEFSINSIYGYNDLTEPEKDKFALELLPKNSQEEYLFRARMYELLGGESGFNELMKLLEKNKDKPHKKE